jgi:hypothetical protein
MSFRHGKPAQSFAPNVVHRPQPHHAATTGVLPSSWQPTPRHPTPAQQYAAQHGHYGHAHSSSLTTNHAPSHHGPIDNSDASSVYSGHSHSSHGHHSFNPASFGQAYNGAQSNQAYLNANAMHPMGGQPNFHASYPASAYAQPVSAPTSTQPSSFPAQQTTIPPPPHMNASYRPYANVPAPPSLSPQSPHASQYSPLTPPNSAPPTMQSFSSQSSQSPQSSYTPTSYGSSSNGSAQTSPSAASANASAQFAHAQATGYAPTTYQNSPAAYPTSASPPASAGFTQPAQYGAGYLPPGAAAPAFGRSDGRATQAEQRASGVQGWAGGINLATAGLQFAGAMMTMMNNTNGEGESINNNA